MRPNLVQVTFRFPNSLEMRYLERPPATGETITTKTGGVWVVSDVHPAGYRQYTAACARPQPPRKGVLNLASNLLRRSATS